MNEEQKRTRRLTQGERRRIHRERTGVMVVLAVGALCTSLWIASAVADERARRASVGITAAKARAAARREASEYAERIGVSIPPRGWRAACANPTGARRSKTWNCRVRSVNNNCAGTMTVHVDHRGRVRTRQEHAICRARG